uniref:Uncharacterized protein n=1 Tax=Octopus bimaculoides TaxID=37653 RepID=A0A0L8FL73_OCTBM
MCNKQCIHHNYMHYKTNNILFITIIISTATTSILVIFFAVQSKILTIIIFIINIILITTFIMLFYFFLCNITKLILCQPSISLPTYLPTDLITCLLYINILTMTIY